MPVYHYRINLTCDGDRVNYEVKNLSRTQPKDLPRSIYNAIGKLTDEYLEEFIKNKNCPNTLDVKIKFKLKSPL